MTQRIEGVSQEQDMISELYRVMNYFTMSLSWLVTLGQLHGIVRYVILSNFSELFPLLPSGQLATHLSFVPYRWRATL
jgi:hypothetical protein